MKILFSITYFDPYISGLTIYVVRLARALAKKGYTASVLCMQHDPRLSQKETRDGVIVYRAKPVMALSKGFLSLQWLFRSWKLVKEADAVIVNLPQFEGVVPALIGRLMGKKVIAIYHCEIVLSNTFIDQIIQSLVELSNVVSLLLSDTVVTYTDDFAKRSRLLRWVKHKVRTVYPPIVAPLIDTVVQKRLKKQIGKTDVIIGVAARLAREKGIECLLEALPLVNRHPGLRAGIQGKKQWIPGQARNDKEAVKIVVAGPMEPVGEGEYKQEILQLVRKHKHQVVFLGSLSQREIGAFYSLLNVLVLPSINSTEAFGMVQVEAMYCGVPVVTTNLPGVRVPIALTGMGIVVPPKNSQKLADAIVEIIKNKERYIKPKAFIEKEFSFDKTLKFYQNLL